jgi:plastocyanin
VTFIGSGRARVAVVVALFAALFGCSKSSTSPTPTASATITITSSGISPKSVQVSAGDRVLFVNNDSQSHNMASDPHPEHTDCPEINQVGFLSPGQSRETGNLVTVRSCGFHDHDNPTAASLQGTILIK